MILLILSIAFLLISVIFFARQFNVFKRENSHLAEVKEIFRPLEKVKSALDTRTKTFTELQKDYQSQYRLLKSNEELLTQYDIGVGTVDKVVYNRLGDASDLHELEVALSAVEEEIKSAVKNKVACVCKFGNEVRVNNKRSEAKKLFDREIKLRIRCLDNDVKSAIELVDWNNINRLIMRIRNSYAEINATGEIVKTFIQPSYLELKIRELRLSYEIAQLKADIKEEEREERRRTREAEREEANIKAAAQKAHDDRVRMEALIQEEVLNLQDSNQAQRDLLEQYQQELVLLKEKENRAISMAQLTRSGYVYVISNSMAFGESICKIGMTRRVDPNERIAELSGASVPDLFSVHGFIFSEDAPKLEKELHDKFASSRVNLVNKRKEFFFENPQEVINKIGDLYPNLKVESVIL